MSERIPGKLYVVLACGPGPDSDFVELEDHKGRGVGGYRWLQEDGLWLLEVEAPAKPSIPEDPDPETVMHWDNPGTRELGTDRPDDTYCPRCDVFGHAEDSPWCKRVHAP